MVETEGHRLQNVEEGECLTERTSRPQDQFQHQCSERTDQNSQGGYDGKWGIRGMYCELFTYKLLFEMFLGSIKIII